MYLSDSEIKKTVSALLQALISLNNMSEITSDDKAPDLIKERLEFFKLHDNGVGNDNENEKTNECE